MGHKGKLENYLKGVKDGLGIGIAYIPSGMTLGLISNSFGMKSILMALMSLTLCSDDIVESIVYIKIDFYRNSSFCIYD